MPRYSITAYMQTQMHVYPHSMWAPDSILHKNLLHSWQINSGSLLCVPKSQWMDCSEAQWKKTVMTKYDGKQEPLYVSPTYSERTISIQNIHLGICATVMELKNSFTSNT